MTIRRSGAFSFSSLAALAAWFASGLVGCNSEPILPESTGASTTKAFVAVFEDDADPAIAALNFTRDELLVQPFPGADPTALAALYADVGASVSQTITDIDLTVLKVDRNDLVQVAQAIARSKLVEAIHKNYEYQPQMLPDDPLFSDQDYLASAGVIDAWSLSVGSADILAAVVDTGVDTTHPDLSGKIVEGWNVFDDSADFGDQAGHGTRVAGVLAAAGDNEIGVAGVAWNSPLLAVRVTNAEGKSTSRHIASGILWAVAHGAKVINVSFAPLWSNRVVQAAAEQAFNQGALVIISAGNGGGISKANGYEQSLFVGALSGETQLATFSDQGPFVDLAAPGTDIFTTAPGGQYTFADGTSFAAPIVSGIAALAWSVNPDLRPATISRLLIANSTDLGSAGRDDSFGQGAINAAATVEQASRTAFLPDTLPPTLRITSPNEGAVLRGREFVTVVATDPWGVADVTMSIDGVVHATDTRPPYRFLVDTDEFDIGEHDLGFIATDLTGNRTAPAHLLVTLAQLSNNTGQSDLPSVTLSQPRDGDIVRGDVTVQAAAESPVGLAFVEWFVDGQLLAADRLSGSMSGLSFLWRSQDAGPGSHIVTVTVTDAAGAVANTSIQLTIN